jgi:hypothetical protein
MAIDYNAKAYRLLEAVHDLAGGDPQTAVLSARISARTGIRKTLTSHILRLPST